jgi:uncharacterized protein (DUF2141 family)
MIARVICLLTLLAAVGAAQTVRDARQESRGTAIVRGVVFSQEAQPRPLRRASVQLSSDALMSPRVIITGDDGRFVFADLPAGQYSIEVRRSGYMPQKYGAKRPDGPGLSVVVADGQRTADLAISLTKWAAISGIVFDQNGEPAEKVSVEALGYSMRTGVRTLGSVYGSAPATDDRGVYRYGGLAPGDYYLAVGPASAPGGIEVLSSSDIDRLLQGVAGPGPAQAAKNASPAPRAFVTYAPVFFPGTTDLASATKITLRAGEERSGVDVRLQLVPTAKIAGTVTLPDGQPAANIPVSATVVDVPNSVDLFRVGDLSSVRTDAQGRFQFRAVPPGRYDFIARRARLTAASGAGSQPGDLNADLLWAETTVAVNGTDQEIALTLQTGLTLSGRIVFDGTGLKPPADLASVSIALSIPGYGTFFGAGGGPAKVDGTFAITGVAAGKYRLSASVPGSTAAAGWAPRSAIVNGIDAMDAPIEIRQGADGIVITFTDHPTELSGLLQTPAGVAASDYFIIIFATDRAQWGPQSRRTVMARPTNVGRYSVRNLPPGEYYLAAVTDVMQNEWFDPGFLETLTPASMRLTLGETEHKTQDIRIAR